MILAEVFSATNQRIGAGPLSVISCSFTKELDGAGSFSAKFSATSERNIELLTNERRLRFLVDLADGSIIELGYGIIQDVKLSENNSTSELTVTGMDVLMELSRKSVLINRSYDTQMVSYVVGELASLAGWSVNYEGTDGSITIKLDGVSVLGALVKIAEETKRHFRLNSRNQVTFGTLGDISEAWAVKIDGNSPRLGQSRILLPINEISVQYVSKDIVNWVLPLGGGSTETDILTLQNAGGGGVYDIRTILLPNGATGYYIADDTSIAKYGQFEKVKKFDIKPIDATAPNVAKAAQQLYEAAVADLQRNAEIQTVYGLKCKRSVTTILPGQKIRVVYKGIAQNITGSFTYLDIDEYLWVLSVKEDYSSNDTLDLKVSNVDIRSKSAVGKVAETVEKVDIASIRGF